MMPNSYQFRLWLREAPRSEVATWAVVIGVVLTLLVWLLGPAATRSERAEDTLGAGPGGEGGATSGQGAVTGTSGTDGSDPGTTGPRLGGGASGPSTGSGSGVSPGTTGVTGAAGATTGTTGAGSGGSVARRASDRGVTAETIKVGVTILNLGGFDQSGFALGLRSDVSQAIDAFVADLNRRGGVSGRRVVAEKVRVDPLNASDVRAKCLQLTESAKVFAVVDGAGAFNALGDAVKGCVPIEHATPLMSAASTSEFERRARGYAVTMYQNFNRSMRNWVFAARDAGFFDPRKGFRRLGILSEECYPSAFDAPGDGLKAWLRAAGVQASAISEFRVSCDLGTAQRQIPSAVLQHKAADVSLVFPGAIFSNIQTYLQHAEAQQFRPRYFASDYRSMTRTTTTKNFNERQFNGARAVSNFNEPQFNAGKALSPLAKRCSGVLVAHGLAAVQNYDRDSEVLAICEFFELFRAVAARAGVNPTRAAWVKALPTVGRFEPASTNLAIFDRPGKVSGGDTIVSAEWRSSCRCWVAIAPVRRAYG